VTRLTEEKTGIGISDSVVMGDVQQNILNIGECPSCSASGGVTIMKCQNKQCTSIKFCNSCHRNCRYSEGRVTSFDSGAGAGPFCSGCLTDKITQFNLEKEERERLERLDRLERERLERERLDRLERERLERERLDRLERERLERERLDRLERERLERERLERKRLHRLKQKGVRQRRIKTMIQVLGYLGFVLFWTIIQEIMEEPDRFESFLFSAICCGPFCYAIIIHPLSKD
jgi:hypothetical protein